MTPGMRAHSRDIRRMLAAFAAVTFALNFPWELAQAPLFASMGQLAFEEAFLACLRATLGDVVLALAAYLAVALATQDLLWALRPGVARLAAFSALGIGATIILELHATGSGRWVYGDSMPRLPPLGVGLSPILQWTFLPPTSVVAVRRLMGTVAARSGTLG